MAVCQLKMVTCGCLFWFSEPHRGVSEKDCLPPVSPLVEAEMMRIDNVLSNFGDSSCEAPPLVPHQTPQRVKTCKKRKSENKISQKGQCIVTTSVSTWETHPDHNFHCIVTSLCVGFITLCVLFLTGVLAHLLFFSFLTLGSHLPSPFYRWAWCKDSGAGLESVWCDQSVPRSLSQVLLWWRTPLWCPLLHSRSYSQAALHHGGGLQGTHAKCVSPHWCRKWFKITFCCFELYECSTFTFSSS